MLKTPAGQECKICARPFTVFKWKAGTKGRFKKTEICQTCAKLKNVCQTCLFDLKYGLPVELRDKFLEGDKVEIPKFDANRDYWAEMANRNIETLALPYDDEEKNKLLEQHARLKPYYKRNLPHICSFYIKGECKRGDECPYRHELPEEGPLAQQNLQDRYHGKDDPLANKILSKIMNSNKAKPPADKTITTLVIRDITPEITQSDLSEALEKYGTVDNIKMISHKNMAVAIFSSRTQAESAITELYGKFVVKNIRLGLAWSRYQNPQKQHLEEANIEYDESLLVPQPFQFPQMKPGNPNIKPPILPPKDAALNPQVTKNIVMDLSKPGNYNSYPSMNPYSMGGLKNQAKKV